MKKTISKKPIRAVKIKTKSNAPQLIIPNAKLFKNLLEVIETQLNEAEAAYNAGNMTILNMDPANVSFITLKLKKPFFRKNNFKGFDFINISSSIKKGEEETPLTKLGAFLKGTNEGDILVMEQYKGFYHLTLSPAKGAQKKGKLVLIDPKDMKEQESMISKLRNNLQSGVKIKLKIDPVLFSDIIKNAEKISESIKFDVDVNKKLMFSSEGDVSSYNEEIDNADITLINWEKDVGSMKSKYSAAYLRKLSEKASKVFKGGTFELEFANDFPLILTYKLPNIELEMILAPRVDND